MEPYLSSMSRARPLIRFHVWFHDLYDIGPADASSPADSSPLQHLVPETPLESLPREVRDRIERDNWREPSVMTDLMQLGVLWWFGDEKKRDFVMNVGLEEMCER